MSTGEQRIPTEFNNGECLRRDSRKRESVTWAPKAAGNEDVRGKIDIIINKIDIDNCEIAEMSLFWICVGCWLF